MPGNRTTRKRQMTQKAKTKVKQKLDQNARMRKQLEMIEDVYRQLKQEPSKVWAVMEVMEGDPPDAEEEEPEKPFNRSVSYIFPKQIQE